jgi:type VI protein secretion system component VasF
MSSASSAGVQRPRQPTAGRVATRLVAAVLILTSVITFIYIGLSVYVAT